MMRRLLFIILASISISSTAFCLNLGDIRDEIRIRIKDNDQTGNNRYRFTDAQLNSFINQTHRDVVNATWVVQKSTSFELVSGTTYYELPTDFIQFFRVRYKELNIDETTTVELDGQSGRGNTKWRTQTGPPSKYFREMSISSHVAFYPFPNDSSSTGTIKADYYAQANDLSSDSDEPFLNRAVYQQYADLLIYEPCYKVFLIEGEAQKALEYRQYYESRLSLMIQLVGKNPNFIPGFSSRRQ